MRRYRYYTAALLLMLLFPATPHAALQLIYPSENSWMYRSDYLILKTNDLAISGIRLTVNGVDSDILEMSSSEYRKFFQDLLIVQPVWDKGKNTLLIEAFIGDKKIQSLTTELFYNPSGERSVVPASFNDSLLHTPERSKLCTPCHDMSPSAGKNASSNPESSPCATCHYKLAKVKHPHEPVASFSCSYCHQATGNPAHAVTRRGVALCFECHSDKADEIKKVTFPHGPVVAGYCEVCHDPHGTDFPGFMRKPINEVCLSCHEKILKTPHVLRSSGGEGHPLAGKADISPKRKGKELSCASCHDPHGGVTRYFLVSRKDERMALCQYCHAK